MMMLNRGEEVCRDFLAGQCQRGNMCKFLHVNTERNRNANNAVSQKHYSVTNAHIDKTSNKYEHIFSVNSHQCWC